MATVVPLFHFILCSNILFKIIDSQQDGELKLLSYNKTNYGIQVLKNRGSSNIYVPDKYVPSTYVYRLDNKYAIDGDRRQNVTAGALCALQQRNMENNMWLVDLEKEYNIKKVVIYGRTDCCKDEIIGTNIEIVPDDDSSMDDFLGDACGESIDVVRDDAIYTFDCDIRGKFVKIVNENIGYPTLCEVEVWGEQIG